MFKIGDEVYLNPDIKDCKFYPLLMQVEWVKIRWYKDWWADHLGKLAHVIHIEMHNEIENIHIQFDGEATKYLVGKWYLKGN